MTTLNNNKNLDVCKSLLFLQMRILTFNHRHMLATADTLLSLSPTAVFNVCQQLHTHLHPPSHFQSARHKPFQYTLTQSNHHKRLDTINNIDRQNSTLSFHLPVKERSASEKHLSSYCFPGQEAISGARATMWQLWQQSWQTGKHRPLSACTTPLSCAFFIPTLLPPLFSQG